jgi:hypothetical protein
MCTSNPYKNRLEVTHFLCDTSQTLLGFYYSYYYYMHDTFPEFWPVIKPKDSHDEAVEYVIIRPVIEHNMLGVIVGRSGSKELGSTLWGQTEQSCYYGIRKPNPVENEKHP